MTVDAPRGISKHKYYPRWNCMIQRCYNPLDVNYPNYGGREITMDAHWDRSNPEGSTNFIEWLEAEVKKLPKNKQHLPFVVSRNHVDDHYSPKNCYITNNMVASQKRRNAVMNFGMVVVLRQYKKANMEVTLADMCLLFNIQYVYTLSKCLLGISWSNVDVKESPLTTLKVKRRKNQKEK